MFFCATATNSTKNNNTPNPQRGREAAQPSETTGASPAATLTTPVERVRPSAWSRAVFSQIEWRRFEAVVELLFQQAGFDTKSQAHGADGGVDVWLYARGKTETPASVVQCKHWSGKSVGVDKIRELRGVMASHNLRRGQFATTSAFTPDAIEFAAANGINLLDIGGLLSLIERRSPEQQQALLEIALEGEYWRPTCVNCGTKMIERAGRSGPAFWGCTAFPKCRHTMQMRTGSVPGASLPE
ncbi:MAG TPA: restriction endonuclease [Casimicrobium sp.]|nr:restriction endonuclease [Casimicrobium sp.]